MPVAKDIRENVRKRSNLVRQAVQSLPAPKIENMKTG